MRYAWVWLLAVVLSGCGLFLYEGGDFIENSVEYVITPAPGALFANDVFMVALRCRYGDGTIKYTTNGSNPKESGVTFITNFLVSNQTPFPLRAVISKGSDWGREIQVIIPAGNGSPAAPWHIATRTHLSNVGQKQTNHFRQTRDIDLAGQAWTPIPNFEGNYYGEGRTIRGLRVENPSVNAGLFAYCNGAGITNVHIRDAWIASTNNYVAILSGYAVNSVFAGCSVSGTVTTTNDYVGGMAGWADGTRLLDCEASSGSVAGNTGIGGLVGNLNSASLLSNCSSRMTVTAGGGSGGGLAGIIETTVTVVDCYSAGAVTGSGDSLGGLVGIIQSGCFITRSFSLASVAASGAGGQGAGGFAGQVSSASTISNSFAAGAVGGVDGVGGFIGAWTASGGLVVDCYATGAVAGSQNVGGFFGWVTQSPVAVSNCYATGLVSGTTAVGGFLGFTSPALVFPNTFCNTNTAGTALLVGGGNTVGGLVGRSTSQMQQQASFTGLNFTSVWDTATGTYPYLRWQESSTFPRP